jgi:hypothetical protein
MYWSVNIAVVSSLFNIAWVLRWNKDIGVNDLVFVFFTDIISGSTSMALFILPCLSLFAKVTPRNIEGTIFAFMTGMYNLSDTFLSPLIGEQINEHFVGVKKGDLSKYYILMIISFICNIATYLILPIIPLHDEVEDYIKNREGE